MPVPGSPPSILLAKVRARAGVRRVRRERREWRGAGARREVRRSDIVCAWYIEWLWGGLWPVNNGVGVWVKKS